MFIYFWCHYQTSTCDSKYTFMFDATSKRLQVIRNVKLMYDATSKRSTSNF